MKYSRVMVIQSIKRKSRVARISGFPCSLKYTMLIPLMCVSHVPSHRLSTCLHSFPTFLRTTWNIWLVLGFLLDRYCWVNRMNSSFLRLARGISQIKYNKFTNETKVKEAYFPSLIYWFVDIHNWKIIITIIQTLYEYTNLSIILLKLYFTLPENWLNFAFDRFFLLSIDENFRRMKFIFTNN